MGFFLRNIRNVFFEIVQTISLRTAFYARYPAFSVRFRYRGQAATPRRARLFFFVIAFLFSKVVFSESYSSNNGPWYTGPLLAPAGRTIPPGRTNFELYGFDTNMLGRYNKVGRIVNTQDSHNYIVNPIYTHGLSNRTDIQFSVPLVYNNTPQNNYNHIGDFGIALGYQFLEQKDSKVLPNLRITLQEIIPTGNFKNLDPVNNGADATGAGSYETALTLNFQHLKHFKDVHYLRSRLSLAFLYAAPAHVTGISSYGGALDTAGTIDPGNFTSADLSFELNVTQHWVAVMEAFASNQSDSSFSGNPGTTTDGNAATVGVLRASQVTLAPAVEYNFNANIGIIGGYWFTIQGKNTAEFQSAIVAINAFW